MTEHTPVFPKKEKWHCSCGMVNDYISYVCIQCGKTHMLSIYADPCDSCGLCKKGDSEVFDFLSIDVERY